MSTHGLSAPGTPSIKRRLTTALGLAAAYYADPIVSAGIGLFILPRTWRLTSEAVGMLLEGTPSAVNIVPALLAPRYGGRVAPGFGVFLTVRPSRHVMQGVDSARSQESNQ